MVRKYARVKDIIVPVRYIDSHSSSFIFGKTVHILEQINVRRQITVHIFAPDGYCLYLRGMWLFWVQNRRLNQKLISEIK